MVIKNTKSTAVYLFLPILLGLSVIFYLFWKEFDAELFSGIRFTSAVVFFVALAVLFMLGRDLGLMWRYRHISGCLLNWRQAFRVNIMCEFTSAATPSAVGGSSLIVLFLNREGIDVGKSTAMMFSCLFLDELFFVIFIPVILLLIPLSELFGEATVLTTGVKMLFFAIYILILLWTFFLYWALFRRPEWVRNFLNFVFRWRLLSRWRQPVSRLGDDLVTSSYEMSHKPFSFWIKNFGATSFAWFCRYGVVNALLLAFSPVIGLQLLAFARQFILWIIMMVSPTPGGSGVSEYMFLQYYKDFFPEVGIALVVAFIWRIITYYMYLVLGAFVVPVWLKKK